MKAALFALALIAIVALIILGIRWTFDDGVRRGRENKCRDYAASTHRFCDDSPEVCDTRARMTLEICLEKSP